MSTQFSLNAGFPSFQLDDTNWHLPVQWLVTMLDGLAALGPLAVRATGYDPATGLATTLSVTVAPGTWRKGDGTIGVYAGTGGAPHALAASSSGVLYLTDAGVLTDAAALPSGNVLPLCSYVTGATTIASLTDLRVPHFSRGGHSHEGVGTPTIAVGAGSGSGATATISGSDQAGLISLTTGTGPTASAPLATITFGQAFGGAPRAVHLTPASANAIGLIWVDTAALLAASWTFDSGATPLTASTVYKWFYRIGG
jgi:hypothetical protein